MSTLRPVPHPGDLAFMELQAEHMAAPALWEPGTTRVVDGASSILNVRYAIHHGWRPLRLDVHLPDNGVGPFPVVVYAHGGSFVGGVKEMGPWATLPSRGIAVVSIEYRLSGEARWPEPVEDVRAAIRWVRSVGSTWGLDPGRVAGWGSSAGGYLMARAALADDSPLGRTVGRTDASSLLDALVLHYAPTDFAHLLDDAFEPTPESQDAVVDVISMHLGQPLAGAGDLLDDVSLTEAVRHARSVPPLHVSHGDADHRCGIDQSRRLVQAWRSVGADVELREIAGAEHADPVFSTSAIVDADVNFLQAVWDRADVTADRSDPRGHSPHDHADA